MIPKTYNHKYSKKKQLFICRSWWNYQKISPYISISIFFHSFVVIFTTRNFLITSTHNICSKNQIFQLCTSILQIIIFYLFQLFYLLNHTIMRFICILFIIVYSYQQNFVNISLNRLCILSVFHLKTYLQLLKKIISFKESTVYSISFPITYIILIHIAAAPAVFNSNINIKDLDGSITWIMYNSRDWSIAYNSGDTYKPDDNAAGLVATDVVIDGEGT